ncbi:MAG: hypothetical protein IJV69_05335 [Kiritimatiellae bacterium]|nr:hypothetical protein [Kiritimatiellia bacterium]
MATNPRTRFNSRTYGYGYSTTTTDEYDNNRYPVSRKTGQIVNLEPVVGQAPKKQDELTEALKEVQRRHKRDNVINSQIDEDVKHVGWGIHKDVGVMDDRNLGSTVINGKKYVVDDKGNITNTVTYDRTLTPEERRRLDAGDQTVLNPANRARGNTYVESQQLTNEDLAKRRWAKTLDRASTQNLDTALRAERMRNKIRYGMLTKDAEMSDNQKAIKDKWDRKRGYSGQTSDQRAYQEALETHRKDEEHARRIALADKAAAAKANELASQERIAMVNANAAKYGHDQALSIAQMNKDAQENVARITATGQVLAAGQKGSNTQDLAKRANEYISLAQKLAIGGTMNEMERTIAETAIRNNKTLSEEDKALKLQELQSGNFGYLANFLLAQAQGLYEQAGVFMPISPAHGQKPATLPTTPTPPATPTTPPATPPVNPTPKPAIDLGNL